MRRGLSRVSSHPVTFGDAPGAQGTVTRNASTVSPPSPEEELRTVIKAFPGTVVFPPNTPVIVCEYVLPALTPLTGPIVLKAPPVLNLKYHSAR